MAKLKICEWGSLDENLVQIRLSTLKRILPVAISYGLEQKEQETKHLIIYDTGEKIDDQPHLSKFAEIFNTQNELFPDSDVLLFEENVDFVDFSSDLRTQFEDIIQGRKESPNDSEWFKNLQLFFKFLVERRIYRVEQWFSENISNFPQDNSEVVIGKYALEKEIDKLTHFWTLCGLSCQDCGLRCLKNHGHTDKHDCKTNHECHFSCQFLEAHSSYIPTCSYKAGHDGKHACNKASHLCGKPCKLIDKRNCQKKCSKDIGHDDGLEDDEHMCQSNRHNCGEPCSLFTSTKKGDYECPNKCIIPCEDEHEQHHCENETCPIECPISDCQRRCESNDHFHAYTQLAVDHFCGNDHQCIEDCEEPGICKILTEPRKEEATYQGLVTETSITFTKYIQQSERLKCKKRIPPNSFSHEGIHSHDSSAESKFHYCDKKCEFCKYYCKLAYGHTQTLHETTHGNMVQTVFTSEVDEFEYNHHKLKIGDQGSFVLCNFHCKELGRHRHIDYCQSVDACKNGHQGQGIIHLDVPISPNPDQKKDFVTHKLFWERTGFKDPYSQQDQALFAKCDHECPDEDHQKQQNPNCPPPKSYCELEIFHKPLNPSSSASTGIGYISLDGHQFNCDNPNKKEAEFHVIFALDRSGSMGYTDSKPLENIRSNIRQKIAQKHNNRIGAVYSAVYSFMDTRLKSQQNQAHGVVNKDTISLILFDHEAEVIENLPLNDPDALLDKMMVHPARGGTNFDLAIQKAGFLIDKHYDPAKTNVVIFLSDGMCGAPDSRLETICKKNQQRGSPLYLYTVLFSSDSSSPSLEKMVTIAQKYLPANSSSKALKCQFTKAINEVALATHFTVVAESLRSHKPSLMRKL